MKESGEKPGPRIGHIQHALLAETSPKEKYRRIPPENNKRTF